MAITLTERAAEELKNLMRETEKQNAALRIWIAGGGCAGLQYGMALDDMEPEETDQVFESHGIKIYVDSMSLQYMEGSEVDYIEDVLGGGFRIENPNVVATCGCGHSFQTEEGEVPPGCGSCGCY